MTLRGSSFYGLMTITSSSFHRFVTVTSSLFDDLMTVTLLAFDNLMTVTSSSFDDFMTVSSSSFDDFMTIKPGQGVRKFKPYFTYMDMKNMRQDIHPMVLHHSGYGNSNTLYMDYSPIVNRAADLDESATACECRKYGDSQLRMRRFHIRQL